ncbi:MAG: hypothetical protein ACKOAO_12020 [Oxalobacteraceae bacterium]
MWQIKRVETEYVDWNVRNRRAKEVDPTCEGYLDPFISIGEKFFERRRLLNKEPFNANFERVIFDTYSPGRLLGAATAWWTYEIDPESGVATCTGGQVK